MLLKNIISNANPVTPIGDAWGVKSNDCQPFSVGIFGLKQRSAACDKLTGGWASFTEEYAQKKQVFLEGPFSEERVNEKLEEWAAQIRVATEEASQANTDAISIAKWESSMSILKSQLRTARSK